MKRDDLDTQLQDAYNRLLAENKRLREALKGLLKEAIVLTDDYLSMFETYLKATRGGQP